MISIRLPVTSKIGLNPVSEFFHAVDSGLITKTALTRKADANSKKQPISEPIIKVREIFERVAQIAKKPGKLASKGAPDNEKLATVKLKIAMGNWRARP